ncbi:MAG: DsrE/DsrF/DrsH-like family protein [Thermoplasmatota archaeon]
MAPPAIAPLAEDAAETGRPRGKGQADLSEGWRLRGASDMWGLKTGANEAALLGAEVAALDPPPPEGKRRVTIILHSGDIDKVYSAFIIGTGSLANGWEASIYFTFWGLLRLRKGALASGPLSKWNAGGLGALGIRARMRQKHVRPLASLARDFKALGGKVVACEMTLDVMGIKRQSLDQDLIDSYGAVGTWFEEARESGVTLFI